MKRHEAELRVNLSAAEWKKYRTCTRKRKLSKARADMIIDDYASRKILRYYYRCPYCQYYHITSQDRK
jgi:hypothetical protein